MPADPQTPAAQDGSPTAGAPPVLPAETVQRPSAGRNALVIILSIYLVVYLADAGMSLADDTLKTFFGVEFLSMFRLVIGFFALLMAMLVYGLMALTPMVPKRLFFPLTFFTLAILLAPFPFVIAFFGRVQFIAWSCSLGQVVLGLVILYLVLGGFKFRWPLVSTDQLNRRRFSWVNLASFVLVNLLVLVPVSIIYLFFGTALAVNHISEGFVALHPGGISVQVRKYVRDDGKVIELFPMSHVADARFYQKVAQTFPTNSLILMEGVTDDQNLLTNKISYKRMARSLGLSEQHEKFNPERGTVVRADIDISEFSKETIGFLNLVMMVHDKGFNPAVLEQLASFSPPPHFEKQLFGDLLHLRNQHLLGEIHSHLPEADSLMIPWGAAHMPGIARGIQESGFHLEETHDYMAIRFHPFGNQKKTSPH